MTEEALKKILEAVRKNDTSIEDAVKKIKDNTFKDLGFAVVDTQRELRTGYPEVIFCQGKTTGQVREIVKTMLETENNILGTRATEDMYKAVREINPDVNYNPMAKTISIVKKHLPSPDTYIAVVTAGTSDIPVAEEAAITAEVFGNTVKRVFDVGVAGIHRLYSKLDILRDARVLVVAAGMEGALPSVVGGLVDKPVIAVPTSIGYGANFNGLAALLGMLNSCASGLSVVNIDNGFGAGYLASMINKL
ncbi:MAG: nickel pincer cofactor biosynthesis protein LarB [Bacteroidota bacterium]